MKETRDAVGYGKTDALVKMMKMVGTGANGNAWTAGKSE